MITVDLQYRRVIELSAAFINERALCSERACRVAASPALGGEAALKTAIAV